jgi:tetratricopeptide (TPR) repeat protein
LWVAGLGAALVVPLALATHARNDVWNDAPTLWYDVAQKSPRDPRVYINLAHRLRAADRLEEAEGYLAGVLERHPDLADVWNTWAIVAEWDGRPGDAQDRFREAARLAPDEAIYQMKLGLVRVELEDVPGAVARLEESTRSHPEYAEGFFALAMALTHAGRTQDAAAAYEEVVRLDPDHGRAHRRLASHFARSGEFSRVAHHLREAQRQDPHNPELEALIRQADAVAAQASSP